MSYLTYYSRFTAAQLASMLRQLAAVGDDEQARMCLYNLIEKSPSTLESALQQDDSFVHRRHGFNKAGRARNVRLGGEVVSFEIERHPGMSVCVQRWALDLKSMTMSLEHDDAWEQSEA